MGLTPIFALVARVKTNSLIEGLSGKVGRLLFKNYASGTIVTSVPNRSKVKLSDTQKNANKKFKEAVAYAKGVLADAEKRKQYEGQLKPGKSIYHLALADFMRR
jgi:hypothetical protein